MIPKEYEDIIDKLHDRSVAGEVNWFPTIEHNTFVVYFPDCWFCLVFNTYSGQDVVDDIKFSITTPNGKELDAFVVEADEEEEWGKVAEIYDLARRKAFKVDKAIKALSAGLTKKGKVGLEDIESSSFFKAS